MKKLLLAFLLALCAIPVYAQGTIPVEYSYDDAGNRIMRRVVDLGDLMDLRAKSGTDSIAYLVDNRHVMQARLYPNPTYGIVNVTLGDVSDEQVSLLKVYDEAGHLLEERTNKGSRILMDFSHYRQGIYIAEIICGKEHITWKIVKQ